MRRPLVCAGTRPFRSNAFPFPLHQPRDTSSRHPAFPLTSPASDCRSHSADVPPLPPQMLVAKSMAPCHKPGLGKTSLPQPALGKCSILNSTTMHLPDGMHNCMHAISPSSTPFHSILPLCMDLHISAQLCSALQFSAPLLPAPGTSTGSRPSAAPSPPSPPSPSHLPSASCGSYSLSHSHTSQSPSHRTSHTSHLTGPPSAPRAPDQCSMLHLSTTLLPDYSLKTPLRIILRLIREKRHVSSEKRHS